MNTQTFELQAVTDEDLQAAGGGIFGGLITKAGVKAAATKAVKAAPALIPGAIAREGVTVGAEALAKNLDQEA